MYEIGIGVVAWSFWEKHFALDRTVFCSSQVNKLVPANSVLGGNPVRDYNLLLSGAWPM